MVSLVTVYLLNFIFSDWSKLQSSKSCVSDCSKKKNKQVNCKKSKRNTRHLVGLASAAYPITMDPQMMQDLFFPENHQQHTQV